MRLYIFFGVFFALSILVILSYRHPLARDHLRSAYNAFSLFFQNHVRVDRNVPIISSDGISLNADIYRSLSVSGRVPTVFIMTPYDKNSGGSLKWMRMFTKLGYAVVIQDMRGRYGSQGVFRPYDSVVKDGAAMLDWIAEQDWSNGKIATIGCSALGESQVILSKAKNQHHTTMIPIAAGGAIGRGGPSRGYAAIYEGGIPQLATAFGWFAFYVGKTSSSMERPQLDPSRVLTELPTAELVSRYRTTATDYYDFMTRFEDDDYWEGLGYLTENDQFAIPAIHINTWHDTGLLGTFEIASLMRSNAVNVKARNFQKVVIGPGEHCALQKAFKDRKVGDVQIGPNVALNYHKLYQDWLNYWLRDGDAPELPNYSFFILGANRWQASDQWPPAQSMLETLYLGPSNQLRRRPPAVAQASYRYDPLNPTPSLGGSVCCTGQPNLRTGPIDQRPNEKRSDIISFRSSPLKQSMTIIGNARAELMVSSDAFDTDIIAILLDIQPDGSLIPIQQTGLRLRYRDGFSSPQPITPGLKMTVNLELPPIAYKLPAGHSIGLHISSSSFPRLERNLNTGSLNQLETTSQPATNTIYFGGSKPSQLFLPIWGNGYNREPPACPTELLKYCS